MGQNGEDGEDPLMSSEDLNRSYLQRDIDSVRRSEWLVLLKAGIALACVAALVIIRQVFFQ